MPKFINLEGIPVAADDPSRFVWYSAGKHCGYWTDDADKLKRFGPGIPCCPVCRSPGMQTKAHDWYGGAKEFEKRPGCDGYLKFLDQAKETCGNAIRKDFLARFEQWKAEEAFDAAEAVTLSEERIDGIVKHATKAIRRHDIATDEQIVEALDAFVEGNPSASQLDLLASLYAHMVLTPSAVEKKYGVIWSEKKEFHAGEPVFLLRATDSRSARAIRFYANDCENITPAEHVQACRDAAKAIEAWQKDNPKLVKLPD